MSDQAVVRELRQALETEVSKIEPVKAAQKKALEGQEVGFGNTAVAKNLARSVHNETLLKETIDTIGKAEHKLGETQTQGETLSMS